MEKNMVWFDSNVFCNLYILCFVSFTNAENCQAIKLCCTYSLVFNEKLLRFNSSSFVTENKFIIYIIVCFFLLITYGAELENEHLQQMKNDNP